MRSREWKNERQNRVKLCQVWLTCAARQLLHAAESKVGTCSSQLRAVNKPPVTAFVYNTTRDDIYALCYCGGTLFQVFRCNWREDNKKEETEKCKHWAPTQLPNQAKQLWHFLFYFVIKVPPPDSKYKFDNAHMQLWEAYLHGESKSYLRWLRLVFGTWTAIS